MGPGPASRTPPAGLLLQHPGPGTPTGDPWLDHRCAMDPDPCHRGRKRRRPSRLGKRCAFPTFPPSRRPLKLESSSRNIVERLSWNLTLCWLEWALRTCPREQNPVRRAAPLCRRAGFPTDRSSSVGWGIGAQPTSEATHFSQSRSSRLSRNEIGPFRRPAGRATLLPRGN